MNRVGDLGEVADLWKGELEGVRRNAWWFILGCGGVGWCARVMVDIICELALVSLLGDKHINYCECFIASEEMAAIIIVEECKRPCFGWETALGLPWVVDWRQCLH